MPKKVFHQGHNQLRGESWGHQGEGRGGLRNRSVVYNKWIHQSASRESMRLNYYVWVIDQVRGQDGWILAKFFLCVFMDRDEVEVHELAKKERGQYPAILTEQTCSIKDLLCGFRGNFACGMQRVIPSGSILPARVANHSARFGSSCSLTELAI